MHTRCQHYCRVQPWPSNLRNIDSLQKPWMPLGHVKRPRSLEQASYTTVAIHQLRQPSNDLELKSFLELSRFFWRLNSNLAFLLAPLNKNFWNDRLKIFGLLDWGETRSVIALNEALLLPAVPSSANETCHTSLDRDAWTVHVESVLLKQQKDRNTEPIGYWSTWLEMLNKNKLRLNGNGWSLYRLYCYYVRIWMISGFPSERTRIHWSGSWTSQTAQADAHAAIYESQNIRLSLFTEHVIRIKSQRRSQFHKPVEKPTFSTKWISYVSQYGQGPAWASHISARLTQTKALTIAFNDDRAEVKLNTPANGKQTISRASTKHLL